MPASSVERLDFEEGLARRLRTLRKHFSLTQADFAKRIGYSRRQVLAWENGENTPPIWALAEIRSSFDVDPEWVLSGPGDTPLRTVPVGRPDRRPRIVATLTEYAREEGLVLPLVTLESFAGMVLREEEQREDFMLGWIHDAFRCLTVG